MQVDILMRKLQGAWVAKKNSENRRQGSKFKSVADLIVLITLLCVFTAGVVLIFWKESNARIEKGRNSIEKEALRIFSHLGNLIEPAIMIKLTSRAPDGTKGEAESIPRSFHPKLELYVDLDGNSSTGGFRLESLKGLEKLIIGGTDMEPGKLFARLFVTPRESPQTALLSEYMNTADAIPFGAYMTVKGSRKQVTIWKKPNNRRGAKLTIRLALAKNSRKQTFFKTFQLKP